MSKISIEVTANDTPNVMGITPGKLYEYLALRRPVLVIGPEGGDTARIIRDTQSGDIAGFSDQEKMRKLLTDYAEGFRKGSLAAGNTGTERYSRERLTKILAGILDQMTEK